MTSHEILNVLTELTKSITGFDFQPLIDIWPAYPTIVLVIFVIGIFAFPEKYDRWSSIFARIFSFASKRMERNSVSSDIQGRIASFVKEYKDDDVLPYGIKFDWVKGDEFSSYVKNNEVVIMMDYHKNNARNFLNAVKLYTSKALLPKVRHEIPENLMIATELIFQEKMIYEKRSDILDEFRHEVIPAKTQGNKKIESYLEKLNKFDNAGFFDTMYLSELGYAGNRLKGMTDEQKKVEIEKLMNLLDWVIDRDPNDFSKPLNVDGLVFKTWLILVAIPHNIKAYGLTPYILRYKEAISKKHDSIFITARDPNIKYLEKISDEIKKMETSKLVWKKDYKSSDRKKKRKDSTMFLFRRI